MFMKKKEGYQLTVDCNSQNINKYSNSQSSNKHQNNYETPNNTYHAIKQQSSKEDANRNPTNLILNRNLDDINSPLIYTKLKGSVHQDNDAKQSKLRNDANNKQQQIISIKKNSIYNNFMRNRRILNVESKKIQDFYEHMGKKYLDVQSFDEQANKDSHIPQIDTYDNPFQINYSDIPWKSEKQSNFAQEQLFKIDFDKKQDKKQYQKQDQIVQLIKSNSKQRPQKINDKYMSKFHHNRNFISSERRRNKSPNKNEGKKIIRASTNQKQREQSQKYRQIIKKIKVLESQCQTWSQQLIKIENQYCLQQISKDMLHSQIQKHLAEIDNLKYNNWFQKKQLQSYYLHRLQNKIEEIQKYHELMSIDKDTQIMSLQDRISVLKHQNREIRSFETPNFNSNQCSELQNLNIGEYSNISQTKFGDTCEQQDSVQLYSQLKQTLHKLQIIEIENIRIQKQLDSKNQLINCLNLQRDNLQKQKSLIQFKYESLNKQLSNKSQIEQDKLTLQRNLKKSLSEICQLKTVNQQLNVRITDTQDKLQKISMSAKQKQKIIKGMLQSKDKIMATTITKLHTAQESLRKQQYFINQISTVLQPFLRNHLKIDTIDEQQNRNRVINLLTKIPMLLKIQAFYCDILKSFQIKPLIISEKNHLELMQDIEGMRNNCNELIKHLRKLEQQNSMLSRLMMVSNQTNLFLNTLVQGLNQQITETHAKNLNQKYINGFQRIISKQ